MIIVRTPVRISFVGGGTDFKDYWIKNGGEVVSTTINKYVYVIVKRRFDDDICLNYTKREKVHNVKDIKHDLIREAMKKTGIDKGVEITTLADIPSEGSGLGSSSSITVALLHAFYSYHGKLINANQLAREACEIEIDILKSPIGIQDQYIAANGGLNHFHFKKDGLVGVEKLDLSESQLNEFKSNLNLFFLNSTRKSSEILKIQKEKIEVNLKLLDSMRQLVLPFKRSLIFSSFTEAGEILHRSWMKKKCLANNISNKIIDDYYDAALDAGAIGGKVSGAGGGGFLLMFCPSANQKDFINKMKKLGLKELPFNFEKHGSKVIFAQNDF